MNEEVTLPVLSTRNETLSNFLLCLLILQSVTVIKDYKCHQKTLPLLCVQHNHGEPARRTADWM